MKKSILHLIVFIVLTLSSCSTDELPPVLTFVEPQPLAPIQPTTGTLMLNGNINTPEIEGKQDVPECSNDKTPTQAVIVMQDPYGDTIEETVNISFDNGNFDMDTPLELTMGTYLVTEFYLTDGTTPLYSTPSPTDPRYQFHDLVDRPVPFDIEIAVEQTTIETMETLCYTSTEFNFEGQAGFDGNTQALWPLLFYNAGCVARVVLEDFSTQYPLPQDSPLVIPIKIQGSTETNIYRSSDDALLNKITFDMFNNGSGFTRTMTNTEYNPDNGSVINENTIEYQLITNPNNGLDFNNDGIMDASDSITVGTSCF